MRQLLRYFFTIRFFRQIFKPIYSRTTYPFRGGVCYVLRLKRQLEVIHQHSYKQTAPGRATGIFLAHQEANCCNNLNSLGSARSRPTTHTCLFSTCRYVAFTSRLTSEIRYFQMYVICRVRVMQALIRALTDPNPNHNPNHNP